MNLADKVGSILLGIGTVSLMIIIWIIGIFDISYAEDIMILSICFASVAFCLLAIGIVFFNININNILFDG